MCRLRKGDWLLHSALNSPPASAPASIHSQAAAAVVVGPAVAAAAAGPVASSLPLLVRFNNVNNLILCLNGAPPIVCQTWGIQKQNEYVRVCVLVCACLCMYKHVSSRGECNIRGEAGWPRNDFYCLISFLSCNSHKIAAIDCILLPLPRPLAACTECSPIVFWGQNAKCFK